MEITEGNKLIAEFIKIEIIDVFDGNENKKIKAWKPSESFPYVGIRPMWIVFGDESRLLFHSSWDWLMPVVEKIEKGNYGFKCCRKRVEVFYDDTKETILSVKLTSRIESLWEAVVQFIQWQQSNSHENNT